jgi:hypothetical protein
VDVTNPNFTRDDTGVARACARPPIARGVMDAEDNIACARGVTPCVPADASREVSQS